MTQLTHMAKLSFAILCSILLLGCAVNHSDVAGAIHCQTIPPHTDRAANEIYQPSQLCTRETMVDKPIPVNKVTFFVKTPDGEMKALNQLQKSGNASFLSFNFSEQGKYLAVTLTEEGHAFVVFFNTQQFIRDDKNSQVGEVFDEYYLDHIETFYDNGDFVFAIREGTISACLDGETEIVPATANTTAVKRCLFQHNILDQYHSLLSNKAYLPSRSKRQINMPYVCKRFH